MSRNLFSLACVLVLSPSLLRGQNLTLDRCDEPREPIGVLTGEGTVRYYLTENGHPDTASVRVAEVHGVSDGGYRSAVVRELSACRMKGLHDRHSGLVVRETIAFVGAKARTTIRMAPPVPDTGSEAALLEEPVPGLSAGSMVRDDSTVEEHPRFLSCTGNVRPPAAGPPAGRYRSREEADAAFNAWAQQHSGSVRFLAVVGTDGRIPRDMITIEDATNAVTTNDLLNEVADCRYTPGRIGGVPVPTRIRTGRSQTYELAP